MTGERVSRGRVRVMKPLTCFSVRGTVIDRAAPRRSLPTEAVN
jgi:hypothetical protein